MTDTKVKILERTLQRERVARKHAETILENKSLELYELTEKLKNNNSLLENLLNQKNLELQGVFKNIVDAYCIMDMYGSVLELNEATLKLLGLKSRPKNLNLLDFLHIDDVVVAFDAFNELKWSGEFKDLRVRIVSRDKKIKQIHINASLICDSQGRPVAVQGIARDITQEFQVKQNLIESESRLKTLILNLDSAILLEDESGKVVFVNTMFCNLFAEGKNPNSLISKPASTLLEMSKVHFEDQEKHVTRIHEIKDQQKESLGEELYLVNGKILERDFIPIKDGGENKGNLWSFRDITLERNYFKTLEAEKHKYSSIIANMHLGLIEANVQNKIILVNQSFEKLSGYSKKELIGKDAIKLLVPNEDKALAQKIVAKTKAGLIGSQEVSIKTKTGECKSVLVSSAPNYDITGQQAGSIGVVLDITVLKELESQKEDLLKTLEKSNNELQEYAHVVSHDLKSPLRNIFALVAWIKEDSINSLSHESLANLAMIESTLEHMERLISDILDYSSIKIDKNRIEPVDINEIVDEVKEILIIPKHISVNTLNKLPVINGDKVRFQQLFQNLIENAVKYIDKPKGLVRIAFEEQPSHYQFSISDNGIGIQEKYFDKIFEIFNSLSNVKNSSGVGLNIVKKIVQMYNGNIWLESETSKGSTFYFTIAKSIKIN
ncbi:PAS domain S-box protein [Geojedonia litorea]|uniref:histidine kinase n=1 Tax=Geojedonia litorea TaxID=1268269 RepID=A0ABV9N6M3_9FLAO